MPKTLDILKKRWIEVAFLVCFIYFPSILSIVVSYGLRSEGRNTGLLMPLSFVLFSLSLVVYVFYVFFYAGFLRSACIYGEQRQKLGTLYKIGSPFFKQILIFRFMTSLIFAGWYYFPYPYLVNLVGIEFAFSHRWVFRFMSLVIAIAFLKLQYFIPSLIIVRKLNIITAFKALKQYKLFAAKEMLMIFALSYVVRWVGNPIKVTSVIRPVYFVSETALHLIQNVFSLAIMLSAVKFIAENTETVSEAAGEIIE